MKFETYISKKIKGKERKIKPTIQTLNEIKKSIKKPNKLIIGIIFLIISLVFFIILMINFELLYYSEFSIKLIFLLIIGCSLGMGFILFVPAFLNFLTKRSEIKKDQEGSPQKIVEYSRPDILEEERPKILYESITKPYTPIKEEKILNRSERIKTNADFPERWAMIYGKKPKERENFLFFKDIELNFSPKLFHPNYFHLKIVHFIEELGYRIKINKPPLSTGNHQDRNWTSALGSYDLNGTIKASIRTSRRKSALILISLIIGIIFLVVSIVLIAILINDLLILKLLENIVRLSLFYVFLFLFAIATILILLFLLNFKKVRGQTQIGYTNIYLIEQGIAYFGEKEIRDEVKKPIESTKMPLIGMDMKISIASAVKSMDLDKSREDISKLWEKIEEYYNALI